LNVNVGDLAEDGGDEIADVAFDQRPMVSVSNAQNLWIDPGRTYLPG
jgi:hypothetical protein